MLLFPISQPPSAAMILKHFIKIKVQKSALSIVKKGYL